MGGHDRSWLLAGWALCWLGGVALQLQQPELGPLTIYIATWVAGALACAMGWRWRRVRLVTLLAAVAMAWGTAGWRADVRLAQRLPSALEGVDLQLTGVVASLPQQSALGLRFRFEVEAASLEGTPVTLPERVSLGWYVGREEGVGPSAAQQSLRAGQRWRFVARLKQPHGHVNPHGFDYELHLFEQNLRATGYVREGRAPPELLSREAGHLVERWRQRVRDAIDAAVPDPRIAGVLAALAIGDQSAIDRDDWELFRDTGVAHLMSISGLHVTMFGWATSLLVTAGWRRSPAAMRWVPSPTAGRLGGLLAAAAYAVFSGWGVPAQRTVWMLAVVTLLTVSGRRWPWPLVLVTAAVVVTAIDPWALLQPGFWLSFTAVGLLMMSEPSRHDRGSPPTRWQHRIWEAMRGGVRTQLIATLGLTPLTLLFFQQVSVVGFIANLFAIPLVTLVVTPLALAGVVWTPFWAVAAWVQGGLTIALTWLSTWPGAVWVAPVAPLWAQAAGLLAAALMVMPLPWRLRLLAVPLLVPLLWPVRHLPAPGDFEMLAVDVGQGTAVLVRTERHLLVYDTGPQYSPDNDAGQRVLMPLLRARGEARIDRLMLSHRDLDHVGGAATVLQHVPVSELLSSLEDGHPLQGMGDVPARRCMAGQAWTWDGVRFEVLHPLAQHYDRQLKPNAVSCVLKVSAAQGSALLAGDIERLQEYELVAAQTGALRSDVLLVPHHGSRTSSTALLLDEVMPTVAVIQAGYRNRFGHPVAEVLLRLEERGAAIHTSAACGAWRWPPGASAASGTCERQRVRRYWHHPGGAG